MKMGLRMTTLHEEPLKALPRKHSFDFLTDEPIAEQCEDGLDEKSNNQVNSNNTFIYFLAVKFFLM